jgi:GNAT superfamily N-acetyltransferase
MTKVRPMASDDVAVGEAIWFDAINGMRAARGLPVEIREEESAQRTRARLAHILATDPEGSWVAEDGDGQVVGLTQGLLREDVFVLSLLGVSPRSQEKGTGKLLLDAALSHGAGARAGMIQSSQDPRAMRRYSQAGFDLHPCIAARGLVNHEGLGSGDEVRDGGPGDLAFAADLDRRMRGGPHGPDLEMLLAQDCRLLVLDGRGYALARGGEPIFLNAVTDEDAAQLLRSCLRSAAQDEVVTVNWITAPQQWAIQVAVAAGLALYPVGPLMTRGLPGPPRPYLPSGAFG